MTILDKKVKDQVGAKVRAQAWDQTLYHTGSSVVELVGFKVRIKVRDQVLDRVSDKVENPVTYHVGGYIGEALRYV